MDRQRAHPVTVQVFFFKRPISKLYRLFPRRICAIKTPWICQTCHLPCQDTRRSASYNFIGFPLKCLCFIQNMASAFLSVHMSRRFLHDPTPLLKVMVRCQFFITRACTSLVGPSLIIDRHHGNCCRLLTISAAKCWKGKKKNPNNTKTRRTATHFTAGVGCTDGEDRQTAGRTSRQRGRHSCRQADGIGKWVDGQKGEESRSQTDRKTDGKLTGRQKGGRDDK